MNINTNNKKNAARMERLQQRADAGFVAARYPEVASIAINMTYNQKGIAKSLPRVVNFFPGSYALFRVDCLSKGCVDGGFDLNQTITTMIRNRRGAAKGEISCDGNGVSAGHSSIIYEVTIQYT